MPPTPDEITRDESESRGRYAYRVPGEAPAEMTYSRAGAALIIIDHTEVPGIYRGQGVGQALVACAVADARAEGRRVMPLCPFAAAMFRRHPDWHDLLPDREEKTR